MLMEIKGQETVSGCKNPFPNFSHSSYALWCVAAYFLLYRFRVSKAPFNI